MYTSQITAVALTAIVAMLQTCPAPILPGILSTLSGGSSKRSDITNNIDRCLHDGREATEHVRFTGESTLILEGVPPSCMAEVNAWNAHPHAELLSKDYGTVKVLNSSAIEIDGLPRKTALLVQGAMTKPQ
ncbi:MAG: hypothetical protein Q9195_004800 [Heterodermia aff. obscurata]